MGLEISAALAYASIAATVVGAGVSVYASQQAASQAEAQANYNAQVQRNNAILAQYQAQQVASEQAAQAEMFSSQAQWAQYQQQVAEGNARISERNAANVLQEGSQDVFRRREEQRRLLARQTASIADAGLVAEGTPLAVLGDTARVSELDIADNSRASAAQAGNLLIEADNIRAGAASLSFDSAVSRYNSSVAASKSKFALSDGAYQSGMFNSKANFTLLQGRDQSNAYKLQGYGQAASGISQAAGTYNTYNANRTPAKTGYSTT